MTAISGIWLPVITPFADGAVDLAGYERLLEHYLARGVTEIFPLGTTGESPRLDEDEMEALVEYTVRAVAGRVPIFVEEANPMPIKHCLWRQGLIASPECRLPLTRISEELAAELEPALHADVGESGDAQHLPASAPARHTADNARSRGKIEQRPASGWARS